MRRCRRLSNDMNRPSGNETRRPQSFLELTLQQFVWRETLK